MSNKYKRELIDRAVSRDFDRLVNAVHDAVADADRLDVLRGIRDRASVLIRRTKFDVAWLKAQKKGSAA